MSSSTRCISLLIPAISWLALLASLLQPTRATGQERAALGGLVADALSGAAIPSARVTLVGERMETLTSEAGTFEFPDVPIGAFTVRVEADGYPAVLDAVEMTAEELLFMHIELPWVELDGILVSVPPTRRSTESVRGLRNAFDLVAQQIPGALRVGGLGKTSDGPIRLRGVNSIVLTSEPIVLLDGIRMAGTLNEVMDALGRIPADHVRRIRVLRGPAAAFIQGSPNGAIIIETRWGPVESR